MPSSHIYQINQIMEIVTASKANSVLDVGVGFGKYGFLAREYLELWSGGGDYNDWKRRIDGIEAFPDYLTPIHDYIYDNLYIGDALDLLPKIRKKYDLILLIDVLEHFTKKDGKKLLDLCQKKGRNILISTPRYVTRQGEVFKNPFELHKSQWGSLDFRKRNDRFFIHNPLSLICFFGVDSREIQKNIWKTRLVKLLSSIPLVRNIIKGERVA